MKAKLLGLLAAALLSGSATANANLLYTFSYDASAGNAAASISFTSPSFATAEGDTLTYVSGDINGCSPATLSLIDFSPLVFATPIFGLTSCGDGTGPAVDGLFFRPDVIIPLTTGSFVSTDGAGRMFIVGADPLSAYYDYVGGLLTIREVGSVSEPGTLALLGLGLAGLAALRRRPSTRHSRSPEPSLRCRNRRAGR